MTSVKTQNEVRLQEEQKLEQRKRNVLILIVHHLLDYGYLDAAQRLQQESGISSNEFEVADNIDLLNIIQEYEAYFQLKFSRKPKLTRKREINDPKARKNNRRVIAPSYIPPAEVTSEYKLPSTMIRRFHTYSFTDITNIQSKFPVEGVNFMGPPRFHSEGDLKMKQKAKPPETAEVIESQDTSKDMGLVGTNAVKIRKNSAKSDSSSSSQPSQNSTPAPSPVDHDNQPVKPPGDADGDVRFLKPLPIGNPALLH